jgi:hypothetical protein
MDGVKRDKSGRIMKGSRAVNPAGGDMRKARMMTQLHGLTPRAIARLGKLIDDDNGTVALGACRELLDRTMGKPKASIDLKVEASLSDLHLQALEELANRAHVARAERMIDITPVPASSPTASLMPDLIEAIVHSDDSA